MIPVSVSHFNDSGFVGVAWSATFKLLTPTAVSDCVQVVTSIYLIVETQAEQSFAAGLDKLRQLKSTPSTLARLGRARSVFEAMLQVGSEISDVCALGVKRCEVEFD